MLACIYTGNYTTMVHGSTGTVVQLPHESTGMFCFASPCSYDVKWVEVCADDVQKFADSKTTKPLIILYKSGLEKGRMDKGANGNELARLVEANKGPKKES